MQEGVGVDAQRGELQLGPERAAVERLDVDQLVRELVLAGVDLVLRQGVEHEGVVRVGAMADADQFLGQLLGSSHAVLLERRVRRADGNTA